MFKWTVIITYILEQNESTSLLEIAKTQTLPDDYFFEVGRTATYSLKYAQLLLFR